MNTKNVLVVDDEATILKIISVELEEIGCIVDLSSDGEDAVEKITKKRYDLAVIDRKLPKMDGLTLLKKIKEANADTVVIMMTAYGSINNAVEAMRIGAYDYLTKPFENSDLIDKIQEVFKIKERGGFSNKNFPASNINFIGCSKENEYIRNKVEKIKNLDATVLITGESGTGKGVIARLIHSSSNRSKMPYINVNCAVLPENLIESELFGHEKGSFTGAYETQKGKFELAKNGTIFLDEIGTLPLNLQAKLLNVLQDREIQRLGSTVNIHIEARIIVATNINLENAVKKKRFREDLYYRLNVISIECVPLRYRKDDLNPLIDFFVNKYNKKFKRNVKSISEETKVLLHSYEWPGNVRELENTIESAIALSESDILYNTDLPSKISNQTRKLLNKKEEAFTLDEKLTPLEIQEIITIKEIVNKNNGHRVNSAKELGISRRTLQYKLKKYGLINWI
ncbi:sigma-54-dependent transcriptional regulator [Clostridium sp.]